MSCSMEILEFLEDCEAKEKKNKGIILNNDILELIGNEVQKFHNEFYKLIHKKKYDIMIREYLLKLSTSEQQHSPSVDIMNMSWVHFMTKYKDNNEVHTMEFKYNLCMEMNNDDGEEHGQTELEEHKKRKDIFDIWGYYSKDLISLYGTIEECDEGRRDAALIRSRHWEQQITQAEENLKGRIELVLEILNSSISEKVLKIIINN